MGGGFRPSKEKYICSLKARKRKIDYLREEKVKDTLTKGPEDKGDFTEKGGKEGSKERFT